MSIVSVNETFTLENKPMLVQSVLLGRKRLPAEQHKFLHFILRLVLKYYVPTPITNDLRAAHFPASSLLLAFPAPAW